MCADEVATLVINEAFPEDSGIFSCEASNKTGIATTSCKIVVKGKFILRSFRLNFGKIKNSKMIFDCKLEDI